MEHIDARAHRSHDQARDRADQRRQHDQARFSRPHDGPQPPRYFELTDDPIDQSNSPQAADLAKTAIMEPRRGRLVHVAQPAGSLADGCQERVMPKLPPKPALMIVAASLAALLAAPALVAAQSSGPLLE